ncbi:MAG: response regulator [Clostridiales bacterium]|nr:response regulator [Clostridiales bacterium]
MQTGNQEQRQRIREMVLAGVVCLFIVIVFFHFTKVNNERIVQQNADYIEDAALQVAGRIEDMLAAASDSIVTMAYLYGDSLESADVKLEKLQEMQDSSSFDYVEYTTRNGLNINGAGETSDASDREYYIEGMKGNSGSAVTFQSRITNETLMTFYAPVYYQGRIIGVLNGIYREDRMNEILSTEFFGTQAKNYMCTSDGTVVYSCGADTVPENMLVTFPDTMKVSEEQYEQIRQTFAEHGSYGYQYAGTQGTGNAYLTGIADSDLMLIQTFPSAVTNSMIKEANAAGVELEIQLIAAFVLYIICLLLARWKQKRELVLEKQEMSQIVSGATQLFDRFVIVDLEKDTYGYLKNIEEGLPPEGRYTDLVDYFGPRYIREEEGVDMSLVLTKDYIREHLKQNIPYLQYEYRIQRETQRWENMSILCMRREHNVPKHILLAIQDVTALKEEELRNRIALKDAFEAAEEANHAKSDFLSHMSHDIRTPMNAIMGMTAVAAMNIDDKERLTDCLNKITLSSRHLLALINDVLDMSKIESGRVTLAVEEFQISQAVESLLAIIHPQMQEKKQQLKVSVANIVHEDVIGDPLRLQQVFVNIMGNAVKFTPEGGAITFSINERPSHIQGSGCYEFVFEDTGIGMQKEFLEKIFEPFARAENVDNRRIEGTGLGMSIARNIVRMMNGDIQIESTPGEGSRFTVMVYLKLQNVEEEHVECLRELRVLVADDEQDACESTCEILNGIGMYADGVLSGDAALERLQEAREKADEYAVVILDWKMPGKCGVETAREIRRRLGGDVPIIILSAYDWSSIEQEAREAGVDAFIAKPLFKSRLVYVLKSVIAPQEEMPDSELDRLEQLDYSGKKVLVVDDNDLNIEIAEELLSHIGIGVETARDGQQAVDILRGKPPYYYDMVFMDIQMPVMDGYEAARQIRSFAREDFKTLPIVAMSADAFSDDIQKASVAGMNDHVAKPIELPKLLAVLEKWIIR